MEGKAIWIGALLLGSGAAHAAEDTVERARRCASEQDSLQRLVCYDRLFAPGAAPAALPDPAPVVAAPPALPDPAPVAATAPAAQAPAPVVAAPVVVPAAPGASTQPQPSPADSFGSDQLRRAPSQAEEDARPSSLTAAVQELRATRPNVFRITLDNGQVWQQMDMDSLFHLQVGDTVEINRGKLGGYRMARQSRGRSGWVRVNRVK